MPPAVGAQKALGVLILLLDQEVSFCHQEVSGLCLPCSCSCCGIEMWHLAGSPLTLPL